MNGWWNLGFPRGRLVWLGLVGVGLGSGESEAEESVEFGVACTAIVLMKLHSVQLHEDPRVCPREVLTQSATTQVLGDRSFQAHEIDMGTR